MGLLRFVFLAALIGVCKAELFYYELEGHICIDSECSKNCTNTTLFDGQCGTGDFSGQRISCVPGTDIVRLEFHADHFCQSEISFAPQYVRSLECIPGTKSVYLNCTKVVVNSEEKRWPLKPQGTQQSAASPTA
eukprot:TRINITY_DN837_c0_g1_i1.p1 TRINITY_DN837_c0_g1~~TRINITY_DN837_c0_g1_i1.p1  ORF type:complete len:150 (+),score=26.07 TRINITY_DN837_c0_g1_i1:49-450(+)